MVDGLDQSTDTTTFWPTRGGGPVLFSVHARAAWDVLAGTRFMVITAPARDFDRAERQFPFQQVGLAPLMVDGLDQPADTTTFWPTRGGAPVLFSVHA
ncbi:hypothetical protein VM98_34165, partial [Streptomyces rubellomurinus subsp. indigoferus]